MNKISSFVRCYGLIAIVILSTNTHSQVSGVGNYSEDPEMWMDKGESWADIMKELQYKPIWDDAFQTITQSRSYHLIMLDNQFSANAIAWERVKVLVLDDIVYRITGKSNTSRNLSKKIYGKSEGISYELLPNRKDIKAILPSIIAIEKVGEEWQNGTLRLKAKAKIALSKILPRISAIHGRSQLFSDISNMRHLAGKSMKEIEEIEKEVVASGNTAILDSRYLKAVHQLMSIDWYEKANYYLLTGQGELAIDAYTKSIENAPELAAAYRSRGKIYWEYMRDEPKAIADFLQAYSSDARSHFESNEFDACVEDAEAALKLDENYSRAYTQRAVCYTGLGQQVKAKRDFIKAAHLGDKSAQDLLFAKGIKWQSNMHTYSAKAQMDAEIRKTKAFADQAIDANKKRRQQNGYDEIEAAKSALAEAEKEFGIDHANVVAPLNRLAGLYLNISKHAEAEMLYRQSLSISEKADGKDRPAVAVVLGQLAAVLEKMGKHDIAKKHRTRSKAIISQIEANAFSLSEVDMQPQILRKVAPLYPSAAKRQKIQGSVTLRYIVAREGEAVFPRIVKGDPPGVFDSSVLNAIERWRFRPAYKDGKAVDVVIMLPLKFELSK